MYKNGNKSNRHTPPQPLLSPFVVLWNSLNANQIDFVETIINHIVANGGLFDNSILQKHPFTKHGSVVELFDGKVDIIQGVMGKVRELNDRLVI